MPHSKNYMAHGPFIVPTDSSPMPGKSELKIHKVGQPHLLPLCPELQPPTHPLLLHTSDHAIGREDPSFLPLLDHSSNNYLRHLRDLFTMNQPLTKRKPRSALPH